jgi:hypothetical protein
MLCFGFFSFGAKKCDGFVFCKRLVPLFYRYNWEDIGTFGKNWEDIGKCGNNWEHVGTVGCIRLGDDAMFEPLQHTRQTGQPVTGQIYT